MMSVCCGGFHCLFKWNPFYSSHLLCKKFIGFSFYPISDVLFCRSSIGRIVLKTPFARRIMGGGNDNSICKVGFAISIIGKDSMRNNGGWRIFLSSCDQDLYAIGCEYFKGTCESWNRKSMSIHSKK